jgi:hypothetical protein
LGTSLGLTLTGLACTLHDGPGTATPAARPGDADVIKQLRRARLVGRACERGPYLFHDLAGTADAAEQRPSTPAGAAPA